MSRLEEIRARLEAATPGPWRVERAECRNYVVGVDRDDPLFSYTVAASIDAEDMDLIIHARNSDLPVLLDVAEAAAMLKRAEDRIADARARGSKDEYQAVLDQMEAHCRLYDALDALEVEG